MTSTDAIQHPLVISKIMVDFAASYDVDIETCLLGTDITEDLLADGASLIHRSQEMRLIENLILAIPDVPALGFKLGLQYGISAFGAWGFLQSTSRTLREASLIAVRYLPLSTAYCRVSHFEEDGFFGISFDPSPIPAHLRLFLLERDMATSFNLAKELTMTEADIVRIEFQGAPPDYADYFEELFGIKPKYHSDRNAFICRSDDLDRPQLTHDSKLLQILEDQCRQLMEIRKINGLSGQVSQLLAGSLTRFSTPEEVAAELAMSTRSLRRKLEQEGTNFRALVESERQRTALQLLAETKMKLDEIAIHLGYNNTSSFTRAFRRWMGCAPGEYRESQNTAS